MWRGELAAGFNYTGCTLYTTYVYNYVLYKDAEDSPMDQTSSVQSSSVFRRLNDPLQKSVEAALPPFVQKRAVSAAETICSRSGGFTFTFLSTPKPLNLLHLHPSSSSWKFRRRSPRLLTVYLRLGVRFEVRIVFRTLWAREAGGVNAVPCVGGRWDETKRTGNNWKRWNGNEITVTLIIKGAHCSHTVKRIHPVTYGNVLLQN